MSAPRPGRPRLSTVVLSVLFAATFALWLVVRPEPRPSVGTVPFTPSTTPSNEAPAPSAPAEAEEPPPSTTTTALPTGTTIAPDPTATTPPTTAGGGPSTTTTAPTATTTTGG